MSASTLLAPVLKILRGKKNSVRYRFWGLPTSWARYAGARALGRTWTDHYRTMVDSSAKTSSLHGTVLEQYVSQAGDYLPLLSKHGLTPQTRFLDFGCGIMRMGVHLVPHLTSGRYAGADISTGAISQGTALLMASGIQPDRYDTYWIEDNHLQSLRGRKFDMIWANSVLTHMEVEDIKLLFRSLRGHLGQREQ